MAAVEAAIPVEAAVAVINPAASSFEAAWLPLRRLWGSDDAETVPQVRWWMADDRLFWEMKMSLRWEDRAKFPSQGFVEGLWEQDVAEFFIEGRGTGHYQEFNLGPGGAWWSACFNAPRVRIGLQPEVTAFGVRTETAWTGEEWIGQLSLPLPDLAGARINFTAIQEGRTGRRFYSLAELSGATPDFHRPWDWIMV